MAKYKHYDYSQGKFIPISFDKQILPGTFEHTLHYLIDNEIDLSVFDLRYQERRDRRSGLRSRDPLKDRPLRLFQRDHFQPEDS